MKNLKSYILEALRPEVSKWIKEVYDNMLKLVDGNKVKQPLDIDIKQISKPEKGGFAYDEFTTDPTVKDILKDRNLGFTVINQMIQQHGKYLTNGDNELKPECIPYWYQNNGIVYFVGLILCDSTTTYIENYANLIAIESALYIKNSLPLLKGMLNDFALHYLNTKGKFQGLAAKPLHPKMTAILRQLGFKTSTENKEILVYKI